MEQDEQLPENSDATEQFEDGEAETVAQETPAPDAENSAETDENKELPMVTNPQATIKIEGQAFELEAALAQDDKMLKTILQPHFASIENANITREVKGGKLTVSIVKRAQHKGFETEKTATESPMPFEILCDEPEKINPAIILAEELMRRDTVTSFDFDNFDGIAETLAEARAEIERVEQHFAALVKTPGAASAVVPVGF